MRLGLEPLEPGNPGRQTDWRERLPDCQKADKICLPSSHGMPYKSAYRAMVSIVQPLLADSLLNGMALLALSVVGYLFWLRIREKHEERKLLRERERNRRDHWGYV